MKTRTYIKGRPWPHGESHFNHVSGKKFYEVSRAPAFKWVKDRVAFNKRRGGLW